MCYLLLLVVIVNNIDDNKTIDIQYNTPHMLPLLRLLNFRLRSESNEFTTPATPMTSKSGENGTN